MAKSSPSGPLFKPPGRLFQKLRLKRVRVSGDWLRIHHQSYGAIYFSKAGNSRWDPKDGPVGAMCVGMSLSGIILERFGDQLRGNGKFMTTDEISTQKITRITITPALVVADIRDQQLFQLGIDSQIFAGRYTVSRRWSRAFMMHPDQPRGLLYNSRHDPSRTNLVLFDYPEVGPSLTVAEDWILREHPDFAGMLKELQIGIAPTSIPAALPRVRPGTIF